MSIRALKTLVAISEHGSFRAAADAVFISHAAVSQQMKRLEDELQVALFDRSTRTPTLNQLGRTMVAQARDVIAAYDELMTSTGKQSQLTGELIIGAVPSTMAGLIPKSLSAFREEYPDVHIRIVPNLTPDLVAQVERGALDAAVLSRPRLVADFLNWQPIAEEPLVVIASTEIPSDDPLFLLQNYPYIRHSRHAHVGMLADEWLQKSKLKIHDKMELDSIESIQHMVMHKLGVSIVASPCVSRLRPLEIKRIPLTNPSISRTLGLVSRRSSSKIQMIGAFLRVLVRVVEEAGQAKVLAREARLQA